MSGLYVTNFFVKNDPKRPKTTTFQPLVVVVTVFSHELLREKRPEKDPKTTQIQKTSRKKNASPKKVCIAQKKK